MRRHPLRRPHAERGTRRRDVVGTAVSRTGTGPARTITGGTGNDTISSSDDLDDTIYLQDGERDKVSSCAGGTDTVYFDRRIDEVDPINCENRITQPPPE